MIRRNISCIWMEQGAKLIKLFNFKMQRVVYVEVVLIELNVDSEVFILYDPSSSSSLSGSSSSPFGENSDKHLLKPFTLRIFRKY